METLFPHEATADDVPPVPGLRYLPGYVTEADERALVEAIDALPWNTEWRRRRQPYGAGYGRGGPAQPIPDWGRRLADRVLADEVTDVPFDQMLVNEYLPGQGISPHRDYAPFGRTVVSLSLLSPCVMDLRHPPTGRRDRLLLEPRSLLVLADEARYEWEHGIAPRKRDSWQGLPVERSRRLSVTFRFRDERAVPDPGRGGGKGYRAPRQPPNREGTARP
ncbi:MAG: alpha-ketoglutarate-dependent dioxygenase AlkB [Gemmataceae bacterium]